MEFVKYLTGDLVEQNRTGIIWEIVRDYPDRTTLVVKKFGIELWEPMPLFYEEVSNHWRKML